MIYDSMELIVGFFFQSSHIRHGEYLYYISNLVDETVYSSNVAEIILFYIYSLIQGFLEGLSVVRKDGFQKEEEQEEEGKPGEEHC